MTGRGRLPARLRWRSHVLRPMPFSCSGCARRCGHYRKANLSDMGQFPVVAVLERLERGRRPDGGIRTRSIVNPCGSSSGSGVAVAAT